MAEPLPLLSETCPPPLPPRVGSAPPPLPSKPQSSSSLQYKRAATILSDVEASLRSVNSSNSRSASPEIHSIKESITFDTTPLHNNASSLSAILPASATFSNPPPTAQSTQNNPGLPSLILSFILREPLEWSNGRLSTIFLPIEPTSLRIFYFGRSCPVNFSNRPS
jgi:hypothetical protein